MKPLRFFEQIKKMKKKRKSLNWSWYTETEKVKRNYHIWNVFDHRPGQSI